MRTVHSVVNRTPSELIYEIILVDDSSTKGLLLMKFLIDSSLFYNQNEKSLKTMQKNVLITTFDCKMILFLPSANNKDLVNTYQYVHRVRQ